MDGVVNVTADVEDQVFADQAHEVGADHADVVVGLLLFADVGIDGGKALGHGAGALQGGLVQQHDGNAADLVSPAAGLVGGAAIAHAAANHQDVSMHLDDLRLGQGDTFDDFFRRNLRHSYLRMLS